MDRLEPCVHVNTIALEGCRSASEVLLVLGTGVAVISARMAVRVCSNPFRVFVPNFLQHVVINSHVLTRKHVQLVVGGFAFLGTGVASFDLQRTGRRTAFIDP